MSSSRKRDMQHRRLYDAWRNMVRRCHQPSDRSYARYGGRGVTVCDAWRNSFAQFARDMGPAPAGLQLDRIDTAGNYELANCRWVSAKANTRNRKCTKFVIFQGERVSVPDLAERFNVEVSALYHRLGSGWPLERALTQPGARGYFARPSGERTKRSA